MNTPREEVVAAAFDHLVMATQAEPEGLDHYINAVAQFDPGVVAEACSRLALTETRWPALAVVVATCREILGEQQRESDTNDRNERAGFFRPISQARAKLWMDHLTEVLRAKRHGLPLPASPAPLSPFEDSPHRCQACLDTKWQFKDCAGGRGRTCGRASGTRYEKGDKSDVIWAACQRPHVYVERCFCR